ncbi:hypothetical protein, variant [Fonticula alba]|uniref:Uncharacterized protein n=1 Tax=Fonticula alba TaxID=691883 RepID=A0A058Z4B2_FONAL|nr:hypothetical protein H696_04539 [Fonticula alba]XP_009496695.1 hypothetical protein, variant [Fonticula alba]KCV69123.1 hypothetical protein H696_04539 [Fonticula alba]KCV69124.1 hypothetical protein, variant [Fonticula alba]|eukprot:XP_009496694.1 hypothetical protein H696_04539 [Fonticula alba]
MKAEESSARKRLRLSHSCWQQPPVHLGPGMESPSAQSSMDSTSATGNTFFDLSRSEIHYSDQTPNPAPVTIKSEPPSSSPGAGHGGSIMRSDPNPLSPHFDEPPHPQAEIKTEAPAPPVKRGRGRPKGSVRAFTPADAEAQLLRRAGLSIYTHAGERLRSARAMREYLEHAPWDARARAQTRVYLARTAAENLYPKRPSGLQIRIDLAVAAGDAQAAVQATRALARLSRSSAEKEKAAVEETNRRVAEFDRHALAQAQSRGISEAAYLRELARAKELLQDAPPAPTTVEVVALVEASKQASQAGATTTVLVAGSSSPTSRERALRFRPCLDLRWLHLLRQLSAGTGASAPRELIGAMLWPARRKSPRPGVLFGGAVALSHPRQLPFLRRNARLVCRRRGIPFICEEEDE